MGSITTEGRHVVSWRELSVEITNSRPAEAKLSTLPPSCGTHKHVSETTHSLGTADSLGTWGNNYVLERGYAPTSDTVRDALKKKIQDYLGIIPKRRPPPHTTTTTQPF